MASTGGADFYGILGVQKGANDAELKRAYRKLAMRWHPDKNKGDDSAKDKFQEISRAYDVLTDVEKRAIYDAHGEEGLLNGVPGDEGKDGTEAFPASVDAGEIFERFFGTANPFSDFGFGDTMPFASAMKAAGPTQPPAVTTELGCTLEELHNGCTKRLAISRKRLGSTGGNAVEDEKVLTIHVQPGWKKGTKITFPQEGDEAPGQLPADLVFVVAEKAHDVFAREGSNLVHTAKVTLLAALTDCVVKVPMLDGRTLSLPCNEVIAPGYQKTIAGEGMPLGGAKGKGGAKGDLLLKFDIAFPDFINDAKKPKLVELLS